MIPSGHAMTPGPCGYIVVNEPCIAQLGLAGAPHALHITEICSVNSKQLPPC
jgi:hypothetical protein